jgi:hypothetical protein
MSSRRHAPADEPGVGQPSPSEPKTATPRAPATARNALRIGFAALAVAAVGLVVGAVALVGSGGSSCRTTAWNVVPAAADLPAGWSIGASQVAVDGITTAVVGPTPATATTAPPTIYLQVSCYGGDAAAALDRSRAAAAAAGETIVERPDLGDGGYAIQSASSATTAVYFRRAGLVVTATPSGSVVTSDLEATTTAIAAAADHAISGIAVAQASRAPGSSTGSAASSGPAGSSPAASDIPGASPAPSDAAAGSPEPSPAAPELIAILPDKVGSTPLTRDSAIGTDVLADDTASRAMIASLATLGATPANLRIAQAYDTTSTIPASIVAFRVPGTPASKLAPIVIDTWLSGSAPGVMTSKVTLGGRELTKVSYGTGGASAYVRESGEAVMVIDTSDATLAGTIAALLP